MATLNGADGCVVAGAPAPSSDCCIPPLGQIDLCGMACAFVELLPSGPMWDAAKSEALARYRGNRDLSPCVPEYPSAETTCQTLVAYAIYLSHVLLNLLNDALAPALRESSPETAVQTLDDWMERLAWQDCYATQCRSVVLGELTPYEIMGECGPIFCPVTAPAELERAVKRGIVQSLSRANMGGVKNLCWLNWVIAPLGAGIRPRNVPAVPEAPGDCGCQGVEFEVYPMGDTLPAVGNEGVVPAAIRRGTCDLPAGGASEIWPGVIAAECIVRSLLPPRCPNNIFRSC